MLLSQQKSVGGEHLIVVPQITTTQPQCTSPKLNTICTFSAVAVIKMMRMKTSVIKILNPENIEKVIENH